MKYIFYLFLVSILVACSEYSSKDYEELNLKGNPAVIVSDKYEAEEKFGEVQKGDKTDIRYDDDFDFLFATSLLEFSKEGELLSISHYLKGGSLIQRSNIEGNEIRMYDNNGDLGLLVKADDRHTPTESNTYNAEGE